MFRNEKGSRIRGWILKNTWIGPVLNMVVSYHDDRYSIEVQIPSLFQDNTVSWVKIVHGVDKYVSVKPSAKSKQRQKPTVTLASVSIPVLERNWIENETQRSHDHKCYEVSKAITRLLRHDQSVPRGSDGAIHYSDIIEECRKKKFDDASQWSLEDWISTLAKGGASNQFLYLRAIHGHSGDNAIDPELQDNVLLPKGFAEYIYHVGIANGLNFYNEKWIKSTRNKPQERKTSGLLHYSEPDGKRSQTLMSMSPHDHGQTKLHKWT